MEFTNKTDYQAGDVSKEIFRRVRSGDYTVEDILLLCRILVTMGVSLSPVAASLPGKLLVEMLDFSLVQDLGGRFVGAITLELDRRMKQAVTGDASYELGDMTKNAFLKFIDKDEYKFGDITKTVLERVEESEKSGNTNKPKTFAESAGTKETEKVRRDEQETVDVLDLDPKILEELLDWDKAMIQQEAKTE
uniref:Uncharacterized protein n=2 Tax=Odontella aurita TaxID=265563 RepID=A0A7S4K5T6_9STRA|mmetsp:Transcript_62293/g.184308  ORF Transcript_62293/g.184308 Transcript_62293/m.184308 type:complete len:192 (+) Transcript_62293:311-886(+)